MTNKETAKYLLAVDLVMAKAELELQNAANYRIVAESAILGLRRQLSETKAKLREVIAENTRLRDERNAAVKALNMPETEPVHDVSVKAFAEHWASMGKPVHECVRVDRNGDCFCPEAKPEVKPMRFSTENIKKIIEDSGWKLDENNPLIVPLAQEPLPQADGYVEDCDAQTKILNALPTLTEPEQYANYLTQAFKGNGPYYTVEAWKKMGRPRD